MSRTKKVLSVMFLFFVVFCLKTNAYEMNFGNTPAQVSPGETFTVELAVSENTYLANGHITYDSNLFTYVGVEQQNMSANVYGQDGEISWMYTEISNTPVGEKIFKFKFKAKDVTKTSYGDFVVTGEKYEGAKFITTNDYTYSGSEVGGRKLQTVTIYVPTDSIVSPTDTNSQGGESEPAKVTSGDNTTSKKVLPQTGTQKTIIIVGILVFVGIAFVFLKHKKYRKLFVILPLIGLLTLPNLAEAFTNIDTTKIKSGVFNNLEGVSNVVAISPNDTYKYGQNLVQSDIDGKDGVFAGNNLGVQKVTDKNGNEIQSGNAIGSGYKVSAYPLGYEEEVTEYNVVLYGDADGNTTICDNDDIDVIRKDYVYQKKASGVYKLAANLFAYDDMLDVSDIQRMVLKRFDNLDRLKGKDGTDGKDDTTLVNPFPAAESPIKLNPNKVTLDVEDSEAIKATGGEGKLTWKSRNPNIARVDQNGNITGVSKGNTIITVTDEDGNTATVYVIVKNPATSVIIDPNNWVTELDDKETKQLTYTLTPETNPYPDAVISWSSSDKEIATVDENGVVTPKAVGNVDITVTAKVPAEDTADGVERTLTDVCHVVINQAANEQDSYVDPEDVTLNLNEKYKEKTQDLTIYLSPEYSNSTVEWKIEDGRDEIKFTDTTDITAKTVTVEGVKVTDEDVIVTVTVTNQNPELPGFTKDVVVRVIKSASTIDDVIGKDPDDVNDANKGDNVVDGSVYPIVDGTLILPNDSTYYMGVEYNPEDATSAVEWSSDHTNIATVDSVDDIIGKITTSPDQQGYTNIKATTTDKGVESDPIKVYVAKIDLAGTDTVEEGLDIEDIVANVYPADLRTNTIKWETEDPEIATVDSNGKVHGVKAGTTTLTATLCASDESKTAVYATMTITVNPKLDITDEDGDKIKDGTEIIMSADSTRTWTTNANADILKVEVIDDSKCLDSVNATDGAINIDSAEKTGVATIKISYKNGVTEVINVTVIVGKMTVAPENDEIFQNVSTRINVESIAPSALAIKNETVKWSIDTENTEAKDATIKSSGRESCILTSGTQTGKVTIVAEYGETGIKAKCEVLVRKELIITTGDTLLVPKGQTETIKTNYNSSELDFESEDPGIATVGKNTGVVTGVKDGVTTVTVTAPDGQTKNVKVTVASIQVTGEDSVEVGQTTTLTSTIQPESLRSNRIVWKSSEPLIASVNSSGEVTALQLRSGESTSKVTITATLIVNDNESKIIGTKEITVKPKIDLAVDDTIILKVGGTKDITKDSGLDDDILSFTSNNSSIATIDSKGVVTGIAPGTTYVTVKYKSGKTSVVEVKVIVGSISLTDTTLKINTSAEIPRTIAPTALETYGVTWTSNNTSVAEVGAATGLVTGKSVGTSTITAKITGTDISATCTVTVYDNVEITADDIVIATGETANIPYTYGGNSSDLEWTISPTSLASISGNRVTGGSNAGVAVVTVKNKLTGQTDTANVIIGKITLNGDSQVEAGKSTTITPTISPDAIKNNRVSWTSSDTSKAIVDSSGRVTGVAKGNATITATVLDNQGNETNIKATKTITVNPKLELISKDTIIIPVNGTSEIKTTASDDILDFSSSDESVATVDTNTGVVTGKKVGETTITVRYPTGETATITVKVIVGSISLTNTTVKVGNTKEIPRTINPTALQTYGVTWTSSNTSVADVGAATGLVTGKSVGTSTITAKITGTEISATCTVTVTDDVIITEDEIVVASGSTVSVPFEYTGDKTKLNWTIADSTKATVTKNADGSVSLLGKSTGSTTLTMTNSSTNQTINIKVTVIDLSVSTVKTLVVGEMVAANATVYPSDLTGYNLKFESTNNQVFTVNNGGLITATGVGQANLTVTLSKGSATVRKAILVTVTKSSVTIEGPYGDTLTNGSIDTVVGHTPISLRATASSSSAVFSWTSSNTDVATVNNGQVTIKSAGETTITVTDTKTGGNSATVTINVIGVTIEKDTDKIYTPGYASMGEPNNTKLTSKISSAAIAGNSIICSWNSEKENVATIISSGNVTAVSAGTTKITLTATVSGNYGGSTTAQTNIIVQNDAVAQVVRTENSKTTTIEYSTVTAAISGATNTNDVVQLLTNITDSKRFSYTTNATTANIAKKVKLDLNGYSITKAGSDNVFTLGTGADMTITDTKGNGSINVSTQAIKMTNDAKLTIDGATITAKYGAIENTGTGRIDIYVNESLNRNVKITSTDPDKATIKTSGNIKIGNKTDEKIYAGATKYNDGTIELDEDEDSRPELYIGGGKYGIQLVPTSSDSTDKLNIYWYNGELYGTSQGMKFDDDSDPDNDPDANVKLTYNNEKYYGDDESTAWNPVGFRFVQYTGKGTQIEDCINNIETDIYYKKQNVITGDVNLDGTVDITDCVYLNRIVAGVQDYNSIQLKNSDIAKDNKLTKEDSSLLLGFTVHILTSMPVEYDDYRYIYSSTISMAAYENISNEGWHSSPGKAYTNVPFDLNFGNMQDASITGIIIGRGSNEYATLVSGTDYVIKNNYITFLKNGDELREKYSTDSTTISSGAQFMVKVRYNGEVVSVPIISNILDYSSNNVTGDFTLNGDISAEDYVLYKAKLEGKIDFSGNQNIQNKESQFESYMIQKGYTASELTKENKLYELRKLIVRNGK